jgi:hypothetical protein
VTTENIFEHVFKSTVSEHEFTLYFHNCSQLIIDASKYRTDTLPMPKFAVELQIYTFEVLMFAPSHLLWPSVLFP